MNNKVNFVPCDNVTTNTATKATRSTNNKVNLGLSGNLIPKTATKVIVTDGNSGSIEFLPSFEMCTIDNGSMDTLCEEALNIVKRCNDKEHLKIVTPCC